MTSVTVLQLTVCVGVRVCSTVCQTSSALFFLRIKTKMVQKDAEARMLELNGSHIYSEFK